MIKAISTLLTAAFAITAFASGNKNEDNVLPVPPTYVLVHGAWQAPYVWAAVRNNLIKEGNKVIIVELPGHGSDMTALHTLSLDVYRDKVIEAIPKTNEKVILVGHSMGGMVITAVAEKVPDKIKKLVYIGAFLPSSGQALTDLAFSDPDSKLGPLLAPSGDQLTLDVKRDSLAWLFINDGTQAEKQRVLDNYRAEPAIPFTGKVTLTKERFGSVEKAYIKTLQDIVISPKLQDRMIAAAGITKVYPINTSHSPFLSQPQQLSELLININKGENRNAPLPSPGAPTARLTQFEVREGFQQQFRKVLSEYVIHSISSDSNIMAEAYYEQGNESVLWLIERWTSKYELEEFNSNAPLKAFATLCTEALVKPARHLYVKDLEPISKELWRKPSANSDSQITIMLFVDTKQGTQQRFKDTYHIAMPQFRGEPGVVTYQLSELEGDNTQFVTYEKFRSNDAFQYHLNFPPIQPVVDFLNSSIKRQPFQDGLHHLIEFAPLTRE